MSKQILHLTFGSVLLLLTAVCLADDTDIYLNAGAGLPVGSEPMVIFSLDYRPNLGSTVCSGNECDTLIAEGYLPAAVLYLLRRTPGGPEKSRGSPRGSSDWIDAQS